MEELPTPRRMHRHTVRCGGSETTSGVGQPQPQRGVRRQPRATPWELAPKEYSQALKGRPSHAHHPSPALLIRPFRAPVRFGAPSLGRCPGLAWIAPLGLGDVSLRQWGRVHIFYIWPTRPVCPVKMSNRKAPAFFRTGSRFTPITHPLTPVRLRLLLFTPWVSIQWSWSWRWKRSSM